MVENCAMGSDATPMPSITIRVNTISPTLAMLEKKLSPQSRQKVLLAMVEELRTLSERNFGANRPNRPAEWPPLSPTYQKAIKYFGAPKLILTGRLVSGFRITSTPDKATLYNETPYAARHQFGDNFGIYKVPGRPFVPVINGELTPYAKKQLTDAALRELGLK